MNSEYVLTMLDQDGVITHLLKVLGLSDEWHVLEPVPSDSRGFVMIENKLGLGVLVPILTHDVDYLPDELMIARIRIAIVESTSI